MDGPKKMMLLILLALKCSYIYIYNSYIQLIHFLIALLSLFHNSTEFVIMATILCMGRL